MGNISEKEHYRHRPKYLGSVLFEKWEVEGGGISNIIKQTQKSDEFGGLNPPHPGPNEHCI